MEPQVNGVVRTLKNTTRELTALGHHVDLLTPLDSKVPRPILRFACRCCRAASCASASVSPPDALHIATEGPLGMAARAYAIQHKLPFTTAYHTRFPEYVQARFGIPLAATYKFLHWFHKPSLAVMAPTPVVKTDLEKFGFTNVVLWTRGVDLEIFYQMDSKVLKRARQIFLYVGRVAVEKNVEAFLQLDLPGSKWVAGEGPALAELRSRYPQANYLGVLTRGAGEAVRGGRRVRVPEPHRYLRPRAARSARVRHAGGGLSRHRSDRRAGRRRRGCDA
jgi:glycosyltransferase involved in cell wall biosynthesis